MVYSPCDFATKSIDRPPGPPSRIFAKILATLPGFSTVWIYGVLVVCRSRGWMVNFVQFIFRNLYRGKYYIIPIILLKLKHNNGSRCFSLQWKIEQKKISFGWFVKRIKLQCKLLVISCLFWTDFIGSATPETNTVNTNKITDYWFHLVNGITLSFPKSDNIKRLSRYYILKQFFLLHLIGTQFFSQNLASKSLNLFDLKSYKLVER